MNKKKKLILQILLLLIILLFIISQQQLFFTWESAYRHVERYIHFGPATELHTVDNPEGRYIIAAYDVWIAVFHLDQRYGLFYTPRSMLGDLNVKKDDNIAFETVHYYFADNEMHYVLWAYAKDPDTSLEVKRSDGSTVMMEPFGENIYFAHWPSEDQVSTVAIDPIVIRGYDGSGELIQEKEFE
ncbi:hypothetical protein [Isachenkonia alkalipeptolytica]|uniref:Uncharacterized protein n=1 Tax=Isachenkonia alkalipeptolytica TaxID=2565777 RepID=A0AA44BEQ2_9CLOT|nr:hypothetical protein [Isachenkonia alkalipeptolytica]NBG88425.1 hypothetical protein [Isachenkonia alkalipeptolytica]